MTTTHICFTIQKIKLKNLPKIIQLKISINLKLARQKKNAHLKNLKTKPIKKRKCLNKIL